MKFSCLQQDLTSAIHTVQKAASKNPSVISQYVYIETYQCNVRIISAGSEHTVIAQIPAEIYNEGNVLAPASLIFSIVSKMPDVTINIEVNDKLLMTVSYIQMKYNIQCMPAASFSFMENISEEQHFSMKTEDFKKCIRQTYFTSSFQDTRPILSGILIKCENSKADFVSSDGTRVAIRTINIDENISFEIIIPAKLVYDIINSSDKYDNSDSIISFNQKYIKINTGNITLVTGLISGKFVNYKNLIPKEASTVMTTDRTAFLSILERAFLLSDESLYTVKFDINYSKLLVSSASAAGNAFEEIPIQMTGNPLSIGFNSKKFIEILRNTEYELLTFEFTTGTRICKITPVDCDELIYLISPIRI